MVQKSHSNVETKRKLREVNDLSKPGYEGSPTYLFGREDILKRLRVLEERLTKLENSKFVTLEDVEKWLRQELVKDDATGVYQYRP